MTFWSGEKILANLDGLVVHVDGAPIADPTQQIEGSSFRLKMGPQYYVSATELDPDRNTRTLRSLQPDENFAIPAGQFALLLTEEMITMPDNAMGLFSIRPNIKWKGMVNVSGFHIDPGFKGCLTVAVFNSGSSPIHLRRGELIFPVWFADLDRATRFLPDEGPRTKISCGVLNLAPSGAASLQSLSARIERLEQFRSAAIWIGSILTAIAVSIVGSSIYDSMKSAPLPTPIHTSLFHSQTGVAPASTTSAPLPRPPHTSVPRSQTAPALAPKTPRPAKPQSSSNNQP